MDIEKKIKTLPQFVIMNIREYYYSIQYLKKKKLNKEFLSYILEKSDIGIVILYRIQGMPLLQWD